MRGWLQKEEPKPEESPITPVAPLPPVTSEVKLKISAPPPPPLQPRPQRPVQKIMVGDTRQQVEWSLKQMALAGHDIVNFARKAGLSTENDLGHDFAVLKVGYGLMTLAFRVYQTEPSQEVLRLNKANVKAALLAALRKDYHRHPTDDTKLGATMISTVDQELAQLDNDITVAIEQFNGKSQAPCQVFVKHLSPAFGDEEQLISHSTTATLQATFVRICQSIRLQG